MSKLNVLYQFNEKYAPFAGVSITSLFENNKQYNEIDVYILGENLSDDSINRLEKLAKKYTRKIIFKETDSLISLMKEWGIPSYRGSYAANMRLFLPMILSEEVDRILYLDADTVVNNSIQDLYQIDLKDKALAMALDSLGTKHKNRIGLLENEPYYNSGVILFDLDNWKTYRCSERIVEHIQKTKIAYPSPDQDLLNVVCKGQIMQLMPEWNYQPVHIAYMAKHYFRWYKDTSYYKIEQIEKAKDKVKIYHFFRFLGEFPWNKGNLHPDNDIFDQYLKMSPWNEYKKQPSDCGIANKIEKILYKILPRGVFLGVFSIFHNLYIEGKNEVISEQEK